MFASIKYLEIINSIESVNMVLEFKFYASKRHHYCLSKPVLLNFSIFSKSLESLLKTVFLYKIVDLNVHPCLQSPATTTTTPYKPRAPDNSGIFSAHLLVCFFGWDGGHNCELSRGLCCLPNDDVTQYQRSSCSRREHAIALYRRQSEK